MIISSISHSAVIATSIISTIIFGSWFSYWYKSNLARTERERAYVCTLLSSSITSSFSLPLVYQLLTNGGDLTEILVYRTWTVIMTTFFMTFLVMDLVIGFIFYRNKIGLLTGWIHHITYLGTLTWAIYNQYCSIFIMMCILEIPTFLLALGSVRSQLRRDYIFATTFLLTRILFHAFAIQSAWNIEPFGPIVNALSAFFPVHCFWFYGFIKQQLRLYATKKQQQENTVITTTSTGKLATASNNKLKIIKTHEQQQRAQVTTTIKKTLITQRKNTTTDNNNNSSIPSSYNNINSSFHQSPPVSVH